MAENQYSNLEFPLQLVKILTREINASKKTVQLQVGASAIPIDRTRMLSLWRMLQVCHPRLEMDGCHGDWQRQMEIYEGPAVCGL